jgi:hypothetical protein
MRCNNCGFDNASDATHCIKCNMLLDKTAVVKQAPVPSQQEASYAGTILDSQLDRLSNSQEQDTAPPSLIQCTYPDCGYPYSSELKVCPRCQRPAVPARSFTGTIDPYRVKSSVEAPASPVCYLLPVAKEGDPPEEVPKKLAFTFQDLSIELNRSNLDPGNSSITGKVQAELTYEDGTWRMKDRSELQTTFLLASTPTPLKDGDILLLGDRKFIFSMTPGQ